jgi:hypothetical protein
VGDAAEHDGWLETALAAVTALARERATFTADDVWNTGLKPPREPRALGAVLTILRRDGVVEPTGEFRPTVRRSRHAAPIRVWHSLIAAGVPATEADKEKGAR